MTGRTTAADRLAELDAEVKLLRAENENYVGLLAEMRHLGAEVKRLKELDAKASEDSPPCHYIRTGREGTQFCTLNCNHDAARPVCPTCDGKGCIGKDLTAIDCPDCTDGRVSVADLAALWNAVHRHSGNVWLTRSVSRAMEFLRAVRAGQETQA